MAVPPLSTAHVAGNTILAADMNDAASAINFLAANQQPWEWFGGSFSGTAAAQAAALANATTWWTANPGSKVYFQAGTYINMPQIILPYRSGIEGAGMMATTLQEKASLNADFIINHVSTSSSDPTGKFCSVRNMALDGLKASQTSGRAIFWTAPAPGSQPAADDDPDSHNLVENVRIRKFKGDGIGNSGGSENRWINVYCDFCDGNSIVPGFDTWVVVCTSSQAGLAGVSNSAPSSRIIGTKCFYSGQFTASAGIGFRFFSQSGGGMQATGCEAQDNRAHGFSADTVRNVSIVGVADSNSTSSAGTYAGLNMFACRLSTLNVVCLDRQWDAVHNTQTSAIQVQSASRYNQIRITHYAAAGTVGDPIVQWSSDSTPNDVSINGSTNGPNGYTLGTYNTSYFPTPLGGYTIGDATVPGGNCIELVMFANMTGLAAPPFGQRYPGQTIRFIMTQDSSGGRTMLFWNAIYHPNTFLNTSGSYVTTANTRTIIDFIYNGTNYIMTQFRTGDPI